MFIGMTRRRSNRIRRRKLPVRPNTNGEAAVHVNNGGEARNRILRAATQLFVKQGFLATTTRQIAARANVNEALIFYYFRGKQNLRWAVLEERRRSNPVHEIVLARLQSNRPQKIIFTELAEEILGITEREDNMLRLLLAPWIRDGAPSRALIARFYRKHLVKTYEVLAKYIRAQTREGTFRRIDPWLASRAFFSLIAYHSIIQELLGGKHTETFSRRRVARVIAELWLEGVRNHSRTSHRSIRG